MAMTADDFKAWEIAVAALGGGALTFLARLVHIRRLMRRNGTEDELFDTLTAAVKEAEKRRQEENEINRKREQEQTRVYAQSMERLVILTADLATTKAKFEMLTAQYTDALERLRISDDLSKQLMAELSKAREQLSILHTAAPALSNISGGGLAAPSDSHHDIQGTD